MATKTSDAEFPKEIKKGSFVVTIYRRAKVVSGQEYESFRIAYVEGGLRKMREFSTLEKAEREAGEVAGAHAAGRQEALQFSRDDRETYEACLNRLEGTKVTISAAVQEYVEAHKLLGGVSIVDAAKYYVERHPTGQGDKLVSVVVDELITSKTDLERSTVHLRDIKGRLTKFAAAVKMPIGTVTAKHVETYIKNLQTQGKNPVTNRTKRNIHRLVITLIRFALKRKYVTREVSEEIQAIELAPSEKKKTRIFTPGQIAAILESAWAELLPSIAIGGFAGLRTAEIQRLDWSNISAARRTITIDAGEAKTKSRRVVPMSANLAEWLAPYAKPSGPVSPYDTPTILANRFRAAGEKAGIRWVKNGLRHSFCSYRLGVTNDYAKVSYEAGNSPQMIAAHYNGLASEEEGKAWFAVVPSVGEAKIIPMEGGQRAA